ncbi:MAG: M1 family metallopeptidase [Bacteroidota bacterium]
MSIFRTRFEQLARCLSWRNVPLFAQALLVQLLFLSAPLGVLLCQSRLDHDFDVVHYRLNVALDEKHRSIEGVVTITVTPMIDQLDQISLHSVDLQIRSAELEGGEALRYQSEAGSLIIQLGRGYDRSDTVRLKVTYRAVQPEKGLSFATTEFNHSEASLQIWSQNWDEDARYWYPCYDKPNDKATFETIIRVNNSKEVVSNGALMDVTVDAKTGDRIYTWLQERPIHTAVHAVAAGDFAVVWDSVDGIPLTYYVDPQDSAVVKTAFAHTGDMIQFFSRRIGFPYPWQKHAHVALEKLRYVGMENVSCVFVQGEELKKLRDNPRHSLDGLIAHELAHQWWGNLVTYTDWSQLWLSEGFATYFSALYTEYRSGREAFQKEIDTMMARYLHEDSTTFRRPLVYAFTRDGEDMLNRHTYEKGALVVHMLRYILGDELFWKALSHYVHKHAFGNADSEDLRVAIEESTGEDVQWFFDQWVYGSGYPNLRVAWMWIPTENALRCRVWQAQRTRPSPRVPDGQGLGERADALTALFRMPIEVEVETKDGTQRHRILIEHQQQEFQIPITSQPLEVRIDPDRWVLKTLQVRKVESFSH